MSGLDRAEQRGTGLLVDQGVIRRKLTARAAVAADTCGAEKAWPLALARAARDGMSLVLQVAKLAVERRSLAELLELAPERALIAVLEGPGDSLGVMCVSPPLLAGLIEAQTTGKVSANPVPVRKPTRTDAAMVVEFLDQALAGMEAALAEEADLIWAGGYRYASFLEDTRPLGLMLEDVGYRVFEAEVALGGGVKTGGLMLAVPAQGRGQKPKRSAPPMADPAASAMVFSAALGEQVMASNCTLQAVMARLTVPLSAVMGLQLGTVVPLGTAALDRIDLEGMDGRKLGGGKLGQNRGMRAVRLSGDAVAEGVRPAAVVPTGIGLAVPEAAEQPYRATGTG